VPERSDISPRHLAVGAAIIFAGIAASLAVAAWLVKPAAIGEPPPGARLQTAPQNDIAAFRREKEARLESTGRVDETHVHIPIEQAMRLWAREHRK